MFTLYAKHSGAVYCNRSCLWRMAGGWVDGGRAVSVTMITWNCVHRFSPNLVCTLKVVTISSWLNFGCPVPPGRGSAPGQKILALPLYSVRSVCVSLSVFFFIYLLLQLTLTIVTRAVWNQGEKRETSHCTSVAAVMYSYAARNTLAKLSECMQLSNFTHAHLLE